MKTTEYSEDVVVEQPVIELFGKLRWETANRFREFDHGASPLGRDSKGEVVLVPRLRTALRIPTEV
jgi:type I restriction enzyme R subunit